MKAKLEYYESYPQKGLKRAVGSSWTLTTLCLVPSHSFEDMGSHSYYRVDIPHRSFGLQDANHIHQQ